MVVKSIKQRLDGGEVIFYEKRRRTFYKRDDGVYVVMTLFTTDYRGDNYDLALEAWEKDMEDDGK